MSSSFPSHPRPPGELFPSKKHEAPESYLIAHVDGGSRGNPGPAGYGVVITDQNRQKVASLSEFLRSPRCRRESFHLIARVLGPFPDCG